MVTLYWHFPVYLSQWYAHEQHRLSIDGVEEGYVYDVHCAPQAMEVIETRRGSVERALLSECLKAKGTQTSYRGRDTRVPSDTYRGRDTRVPTLRLAVPWTVGKPATVYNYLDRKGERELENLIRMRFRKDLYRWMEKHYDGGHRGVELQDAVYRYMSEHGIDDTDQNFETVKQQYRRQRDVYRKIDN